MNYALPLAAARTPPPDDAWWQILFGAIGAVSAAIFILGAVWWLLKPRVKQWLRREIAEPTQRIQHQVAVNGGRNDPPTLLDEVGRNTQQVSLLRSEVSGLAEALRGHIVIAGRDHDRMWGELDRINRYLPDGAGD